MSGPHPDPEQAAALHGPASKPAQWPHGQAPYPTSARRWRSTELFGPSREIEIEHGQAVYRLRLTALGKLILTK